MAEWMFDQTVEPGDLIEIDRGSYHHWAIYIGAKEVIHLIPTDDEAGALETLLALDGSRAVVRRQRLWEVVGNHSFKVNNLLDEEYEPRPARLVVRDACSMAGRLLRYSVTSYNCEHFVTELRYGKPESRQVRDAAVVGGVALAGVGLLALGAVFFNSLKQDDKKRRYQ